MTKKPVNDGDFSRLLAKLRGETDSVETKLSKLYYFPGNFSGQQAAELLGTFKTAPEKIRVLKMLENRLCRMSCAEGKEVLERIQLTQPDKLYALDCIKRTLTDHQTTEGTEYILSAFNSEEDKIRALHRLTAISTYANEDLAAGGHLTYGPVGSVHGQSFPLTEHMYGPVQQQLEAREGAKDKRNFPETLSDKPKSMYTCHPSYAYGKVNDPAYYLGGGQPPLPPRPADNAVTGPPLSLGDPVRPSDQSDDCVIEGDPCLGLNQSGPVPIGFIDHKKKVDTQCC